MVVAIVGAHGLLGAATVSEWRSAGHTVRALTRADLDVTNHRQVRDVIATSAPDVVINCTAYNQVDAAEDHPAAALAVNSWAVRSLAAAAAGAGAVLVHYGTDFVFDGHTDRPYVETDPPNPQSAYGASKLLGEWFAADAPRHYVLRVESLFGGAASRSSVDRMLDQMRAGRRVTAFADRTVSPSHVEDVARATRALVERAAPLGLYHCVNSGVTTWLELAEHLRVWAGLPNAEVTGVPAGSVSLAARRPQYAALSNAKLTAAGVAMPTWQDALRAHVDRQRTP